MESLAQTMSVEAIAAIKAKRMAMKRHDMDGKANAKRLEREQQRLADEHKVNLCKRAMERERQHRSSEEQLLGEKELPGVLRTLALVYDVDKRSLLPLAQADAGATDRPEKGQIREVPVVPMNQNPLVKESTSRYNRYGQEKFLKDQEAFGINPLGSNINKTKESGKEMGKEAGKEMGKEANKEMGKEAGKEMGKEIAEKAGKEAHKEVFKKPGEEARKEAGKEAFRKPGEEAGAVAGKVITRVRPAPSHRLRTPQRERRPSTKPIIVVPAALTSLVTIHNAKQLLQEMRFVPMDQARKSFAQHIEEVIIERQFQGGLVVRYRVIDNVTRLKTEEWQRVAAVFAMGPHWQFKGWPHGGDPAAIFHEVCAFHLHFKDSAPAKELRNLQVHMLALPQHERHSDVGVLKEFWKKLDHHIAVRPQQFAFMKQK